MKILVLLLSLLSLVAQADFVPRTVLTKKVGRIDNLGVKKECQITVDHFSPAELEQVERWISELKTLPIHEALHIRAQVPTIEIDAYEPGEKVFLSYDYGSYKFRSGPAADHLLAIVSEACR